MSVPSVSSIAYGCIFLSLFAVDYILGNGFLESLQKVCCKFFCVVKKMVREESKVQVKEIDLPVTPGVLLAEVLLLVVTVLILNKYKKNRSKDGFEDFLKESKDALKQTNDFLEKWKLRRVPTEYSYVDEEPLDIKPLKLEVPILHMAIVDSLGTSRSQPERGDAGDTCNITDTTLLSVTSLVDEEDLGTEAGSQELMNGRGEQQKDLYNRFLWDVLEEDTNSVVED